MLMASPMPTPLSRSSAEGGRLGDEVGHDPLQVLRRGQAQLGEGAVVSRQGLAGAGPVVRQDPDPDDVAQVVQGGIDQQRGLGGGAHLDGEVGVEGPVLLTRDTLVPWGL